MLSTPVLISTHPPDAGGPGICVAPVLIIVSLEINPLPTGGKCCKKYAG